MSLSYKSRKPSSNQRSIASFFSAPGTVATKEKPAVQKVQKPQRTPDRVAAKSSAHALSQLTQRKSAFDEFGSSDTSFGSPEITNFRNPVLSRVSSTVGENRAPSENQIFVPSDSEDDKENQVPNRKMDSSPLRKPSLKRAASSNLFDILDGQPKKALKKPTAPHAPAPMQSGGEKVALSDEQKAIVHVTVEKGENVFFTGSAGTGKSVVLRSLVDQLKRKHGMAHVGITASTGLAACNIQGQTVHKFLSIGLGTGSPQELAMRIKRNGIAKKRWLTLAVLVIDEISMIDGKLFTKIDEIAKILRNNQRPFGGIQIVCSGDFYQLPPVSKDGSQYCFQSPAWNRAISHTMMLTQVFRQKGDNELIDMLNALREGALDSTMVQMFHSLRRKVTYTDGIEPTELFPTRQEVKRANETRLRQLPGETVSYSANDSDRNPELKRLFDHLMCEERVDLKEGAQVMYLKNHIDSTVVNGSIGTVVGFLTEDLHARIFSQFHALDFINPTPEFISVLRLLCGLQGKTGYNDEQRAIFEQLPEKWKSKIAKLAHEAFQVSSHQERLPLVNFKTNRDFTMILVRREEFSVDQGRLIRQQGSMTPDTLSREQLPLLLAWAMSIHKAQGQSIDRLRVDLRRIFEKGQVYVALSRATNKAHLEVLNFDPKRIQVSHEVREFYKTLS